MFQGYGSLPVLPLCSDLDLRFSAQGETRRIKVEKPLPFDLAVAIDRGSDGTLSVTATANADTSRALIWFGRLVGPSSHDVEQRYWSSEDRGSRILFEPRRAVATIPASSVQACRGTCAVGVQVIQMASRAGYEAVNEEQHIVVVPSQS